MCNTCMHIKVLLEKFYMRALDMEEFSRTIILNCLIDAGRNLIYKISLM